MAAVTAGHARPEILSQVTGVGSSASDEGAPVVVTAEVKRYLIARSGFGGRARAVRGVSTTRRTRAALRLSALVEALLSGCFCGRCISPRAGSLGILRTLIGLAKLLIKLVGEAVELAHPDVAQGVGLLGVGDERVKDRHSVTDGRNVRPRDLGVIHQHRALPAELVDDSRVAALLSALVLDESIELEKSEHRIIGTGGAAGTEGSEGSVTVAKHAAPTAKAAQAAQAAQTCGAKTAAAEEARAIAAKGSHAEAVAHIVEAALTERLVAVETRVDRRATLEEVAVGGAAEAGSADAVAAIPVVAVRIAGEVGREALNRAELVAIGVKTLLVRSSLAVLVANKDLKLALTRECVGSARVEARIAVGIDILTVNSSSGRAHFLNNASAKLDAVESLKKSLDILKDGVISLGHHHNLSDGRRGLFTNLLINFGSGAVVVRTKNRAGKRVVAKPQRVNRGADDGHHALNRHKREVNLEDLLKGLLISGLFVDLREGSKFTRGGRLTVDVKAKRNNRAENRIADSESSHLLKKGAAPRALKQWLKDRVNGRNALKKSSEKGASRLKLNKPPFGASTRRFFGLLRHKYSPLG